MTTEPAAPHAVTIVRTGETVEIAPGAMSNLSIPRSAVQRYGVVQLMRLSDGSYLPRLVEWGQMVRLSKSLPSELGLDMSHSTLSRLTKAGFVKSTRVAPDTLMIDLASLAKHMEDCKDPEFWTPKRRQQYRAQRLW